MRVQLSYQLPYQFRRQIGGIVERLRAWIRTRTLPQRRIISGALGVTVVAILSLVAAMPAITSASEIDALGNGGFEQGFRQVNGCGIVGNHWDCFTNGGAANYGYYDDEWEPVVYEGKHSQLIEINTKGMAAGDNDRYAGIAQTTRVVPHKPYKLSLRGIIRSTNSEGDPWRYSVQVGWLNEPKADWQDVTNWVDVGWNTYYDRSEPGAFSAFQTQLVPDSEVITVFVRVWKKWGVAYEELDVNLDAMSLTGPAVNHPNAKPKGHDERPNERPNEHYDGVGGPVAGQEYRPEQFQPQGPQNPGPQAHTGKPEEPRPTYRPTEPSHDRAVVCGGPDLIYNGSFEAGFREVPWGEVGKGWDAFTNGGAANYGFYDEEWDIVVADGNHGQLIEINSKSLYPTDADRYAGIYQRIAGLHKGATYELTLRGELRGEGNEDDPNRFAAQWGLGKDGNFESVDEWTTMDLGPIAARTQPVPLAQYKVQFEAPASSVVLFIRGWKKWAITNVEMDLNLDAISLRACDAKAPGKPQDGQHAPEGPGQHLGEHPGQYPGTGGPVGQPEKGGPDNQGSEKPSHGANCLYVVKPGDTLSQIAVNYGVSLDAISRANGITNPSAIYVGQKFEIPGCDGKEEAVDPAKRAEYSGERPVQEYEIVQVERPVELPVRSGPAMRPTVEERFPVEQAQVNIAQPEAQQQELETVYTVQPGDMLSYIAEQYDVNAYDLATFNGIDNLNFIYTGQVLVIPN